jgi:hypothetical protein
MRLKNIWFKILLFWLLFVLLHALLNFPAFFTDLQQNIGQVTLSKSISLWDYFAYGNLGLLGQLSGELLLLFVPLFFMKKESSYRRIYIGFVATCYLLFVYYHVYYEAYKNLYSVHPIFANDWMLLVEILPTFFREITVKGTTYFLIFLTFLSLSLMLFWAFKYLLKLLVKLLPFLSFKISFSLVLLATIYLSYWANTNSAAPNSLLINKENEKISLSKRAGFGQIQWIYPKMIKSITLNQKEPLKHLKKRFIYDLYKDKKLVQKPNIYLLFIESYGGVATMTDYCNEPYHNLTQKLDNQLNRAGWTVASNYSKSSVIGGRSWLAMTTALIGGQIDDQIQYSNLIKKHTSFPHMVSFFNQQGYETFRVSSMKVNKIDSLNMLEIPNRFWQFDKRYLFPDIDYKGYVYDHFGGIPDQYTLGYVQEKWLSKTKSPFFLSLITMNSHGSWSNLSPPLVENWKELNAIKDPFKGEKQQYSMHIQDYWKAIDYQLRMVIDFIIKNGDDNSVFVVLGDHNPAGLEWKLTNKLNKWATPIHIIAKDAAFTQSFYPHGFTEGLEVDTSQFTMMRHMGLYSLLTRQLLENYGEEGTVLPEYLPWGLK